VTERKQFRDLATPSELQAAIGALDIGAGTEFVELLDADGRVAAERVDAAIDVPGFDRSTMDGYAVQAADTFDASERDPLVADLAGAVDAGERPETDVSAGTVVSVATGAPLPPGADAVVPVERTTRRETDDSTVVEIRTAVGPLQIVATPGHTPGHISCHVPDAGVLLAADASVAEDGELVGPDERFTPDMDRALDSLDRLADLAFTDVLCFHGGHVEASPEDVAALVE